jgi:hypothetical protein
MKAQLRLISPALILLLASHCSADPSWQPPQLGAAAVPTLRICHTTRLPTAVMHQMPPTAQSCFGGSFVPIKRKTKIWLHLFNLNPGKEFAAGVSSANYLYETHFHFEIDLLEQKQQGFRMLQRIGISYPTQIWGGPVKCGAELSWLDTDRRQPVLHFQIFAQGMYGTLGEDVLVSFPHGWTSPATSQSWAFGSWRASNTSGQVNSLMRAKSGKIFVTSAITVTGDRFDLAGRSVGQLCVYYWWNESQRRFRPDTLSIRRCQDYNRAQGGARALPIPSVAPLPPRTPPPYTASRSLKGAPA